jgi:hypothetical protein
VADDVVHDVDWLADAQPTDGIRLEPNRCRPLNAFRAEAQVGSPLNDPELRLSSVRDRHFRRGLRVGAQLQLTSTGAFRPACRPLHRTPHVVD